MVLPESLLCLLAVAIAAAAGAAFLLGLHARQRLEADLAALREERAALDTQLAAERARSARVPALEGEIADARRAGEALRADGAAQVADLVAELAAVREALAQERRHAAEKLQLLDAAKETMTERFRVLAEDVMARHGESFTRQNKAQMDSLLAPMRERLNDFQQSLLAAHSESVRDRERLGEQIRGLTEASAQMTAEATNLTRALKGQAQVQGAWGEMVLETVLASSGLRKGEEYETQVSGTVEDGERLRPDVVVTLPGDQRRIVIDAKVSLVAFEGCVNAASEDERGECLRRHLDSVRAHIRTLGRKDYLAVASSRLDYVVMFVPIEGALAAALAADPGLTREAAEHNVAIATPTTLMMALRTVASVWQVERRNRNAEKIATHAGGLYDKFAGFVDDMRGLGKELRQAEASYNKAMDKLIDGKRGTLARRIEQLREMGANARKSLPASLLGDDEDGDTITEAVMTLPPALAGHAAPLEG